MLNWLLYRPISSDKVDRKNTNRWQEYWGDTYAPELKQHLLKPVFDRLDREEKLGALIIDLGSGAVPVTRSLPKRSGRKVICVDIAADNRVLANELRLRLDIEKVSQFRALSFRKALLTTCAFLEIDPRADQPLERADTIVVSDTLNYVDYRKVLHGFARYLKPAGRIIVLNLPYRGNSQLFSDYGLKDNRQLYAFLEEHHFAIEHKAFPKRPRNVTDEAEELIVLVATKTGATESPRSLPR